MQGYVHGYEPAEALRLLDQAETLADLLHHDTAFAPGSRVLEAGCGVGAQTVPLARNSPDALVVGLDVSPSSLAEARRRIRQEGLTRVCLVRGDLFDPPFARGAFDHVFVCFVLEHLPDPGKALLALRERLRPGGTITVIEGDHGSVFFWPPSRAAERAVRCQVELQRRAGGNALVGRELYPLLRKAGFEEVAVSPRMVYVDASRPRLVDGFIRKTFTAMIEGIRGEALGTGTIDAETFDRGVRDLHRTADPDGVFCYTFFKASALRP